jgi:hypothetical protein
MGDIDQALTQHPHFKGGLDAGRDKLREFVLWMSKEAEAVEAEGARSQHPLRFNPYSSPTYS